MRSAGDEFGRRCGRLRRWRRLAGRWGRRLGRKLLSGDTSPARQERGDDQRHAKQRDRSAHHPGRQIPRSSRDCPSHALLLLYLAGIPSPDPDAGTRVNPMSLDVSRYPNRRLLASVKTILALWHVRCQWVTNLPNATIRNETLSAIIDSATITRDEPRDRQATPGKRVVVATELGYCWGVRRALEIVEAAAKSAGPIAPIGDVIHNPQVVERLRQTGIEGAASVEDAAQRGFRRVAITAHGIGPHLAGEAAAANLELVDTTCPLVTKVQRLAQKLVRQGYYPGGLW